MERIFPALDTDLVNLQSNKYSTDEIVSLLSSIITPIRLQKLQECVSQRSGQLSIILDRTYDEGNINAVMRTMENFGFFQLMLFQSAKTKVTPRISRGADKWLDIKKLQEPHELQDLKDKGFKLYATALDDQAKDFRLVDWHNPVALIIGNEKDGVRPELLDHCDEKIIIPTSGLRRV